MRVRELIAALAEFPPEAEIAVVYEGDGTFALTTAPTEE